MSARDLCRFLDAHGVKGRFRPCGYCACSGTVPDFTGPFATRAPCPNCCAADSHPLAAPGVVWIPEDISTGPAPEGEKA